MNEPKWLSACEGVERSCFGKEVAVCDADLPHSRVNRSDGNTIRGWMSQALEPVDDRLRLPFHPIAPIAGGGIPDLPQ